MDRTVRLLEVPVARGEDLVVIQQQQQAKLRGAGQATVSMQALSFAPSNETQSRDIASGCDAVRRLLEAKRPDGWPSR